MRVPRWSGAVLPMGGLVPPFELAICRYGVAVKEGSLSPVKGRSLHGVLRYVD